MNTLYNDALGHLALTRFLRIRQVEELTGRRKSAIYADIRKGLFPAPVPLGQGRNSPVGWPENEIAAWQASRIAKRDAGGGRA